MNTGIKQNIRLERPTRRINYSNTKDMSAYRLRVTDLSKTALAKKKPPASVRRAYHIVKFFGR